MDTATTQASARARTGALAIAIALLLGNVASGVAEAAPQVVATVPVGSNPVGIGVNPTTNRIYVANRASNTISVVDGATDTILATIPEGGVPNGVAVNTSTNRVYVSNLGRTVSVIDGSTNTVIATVGVGSGAFSIAVNPVTGRVYVANFNDHNLSVIDGATNSLVTVINTGGGPLGVAVNPTTNRVYVANYGSSGVNVIDGATNAILGFIPTPGNPSGIAVNSGTNRIYATPSPSVVIIDGLTNSITAQREIGAVDQIAVNPGLDRVYVTELGVNMLHILDGANIAQHAAVDLGTFPAGIDANAQTNRVYVARYFAGTVAVIAEPDETPPTITSSVSPLANSEGWHRQSVSVSWSVSDLESGIVSSSGCAPATLSAETGGTTLTCTATNGAGSSSTASVTVKIDLSAPQVTFFGNQGTYPIDSTIAIGCSATDVPGTPGGVASGISVSDCPSLIALAYTLALGTHTLTGTATDNAGNVTANSTSFTVVVTHDSLCNLTRTFETKEEIGNALCWLLGQAAERSAPEKAGPLQGYVSLVRAQDGKSLTHEQAMILERLADGL